MLEIVSSNAPYTPPTPGEQLLDSAIRERLAFTAKQEIRAPLADRQEQLVEVPSIILPGWLKQPSKITNSNPQTVALARTEPDGLGLYDLSQTGGPEAGIRVTATLHNYYAWKIYWGQPEEVAIIIEPMRLGVEFFGDEGKVTAGVVLPSR